MRILHTGDWHLGKAIEGKSRLEEQEEFCGELIEIVNRENIDIVIIAGDVFDNSSPSAKAENLYYDTLKQISNNGKVITIVISGNHDSPERLYVAKALAKVHGIITMALPNEVIEIGNYGNHKVIEAIEGGFTLELSNGQRGKFFLLPYPSERRINQVLFDLYEEEIPKETAYFEKIKELTKGADNFYSDDCVNIFVAHIFTMGVKEEGSERSIELGGSYIIDSSFMPNKADYIALGHIHKHQIVPSTKNKAYYCGAPIHYNKRETNHPNSVIMVDIDIHGERTIAKERISLKNYKPIRIIKAHSVDDAITQCEELKDERSWVYVEVLTDISLDNLDIKRIKETKEDIIEIIVKKQSDDKDEENEQKQENKSMEELFREFFIKEKGLEPKDELVNLLIDILKED